MPNRQRCRPPSAIDDARNLRELIDDTLAMSAAPDLARFRAIAAELRRLELGRLINAAHQAEWTITTCWLSAVLRRCYLSPTLATPKDVEQDLAIVRAGSWPACRRYFMAMRAMMPSQEAPLRDGGVNTTRKMTGPRGGREGQPRRGRGRPPGSPTEKDDIRLYRDYRAAKERTGITRREFLREKGRPEGDLAALDRGKSALRRRDQKRGRNSSSPPE